MSTDDIDNPPASDDPIVQQYLETQWRVAISSTREAREAIRKIWPELTQHLAEAGANNLRDALDDLERASHKLHKAGPKVLGQDEYDQFLELQTRRQIEG